MLLQQRNSREVSSSEIGELVLHQLSEMNEVAYVRFASVYRQFQGIHDFVATLKGLSLRTSRPQAMAVPPAWRSWRVDQPRLSLVCAGGFCMIDGQVFSVGGQGTTPSFCQRQTAIPS